MIGLLRQARSGWKGVTVQVRACGVADLPEEGTLRVELEGVPALCLASHAGCVYAFVDECSHGQARLSEGEIDEGEIECYLHGGRFDLGTGKPSCLPAMDPLRTFRTVVQGDDVLVEIEAP